jgi:hypothetical protein
MRECERDNIFSLVFWALGEGRPTEFRFGWVVMFFTPQRRRSWPEGLGLRVGILTTGRCAGWCVSAVLTLVSTIAIAQTATGPAPAAPTEETDQEIISQDVVDNPGGDFARPTDLFQIRSEYKTAPGSGAEKGTITEVTTESLTLRVDQKYNLGPDWVVGFRTDLPFLTKDPINSYNPSGDYVYGIGDADVQAALINTVNARWKFGFGARLYAPTGGDVLGSGKWQIVPGFAVRYALPEVGSGSYVEPLLRYAQSFAGDPARKSISNLQFQPTFNLGLRDNWFIQFYPSPDIRWNFGPPVTGQTGRLFLPFDVSVGRKVADNMALSLEIGVPIIKEYPVYNFKTEARLNLSF